MVHGLGFNTLDQSPAGGGSGRIGSDNRLWEVPLTGVRGVNKVFTAHFNLHFSVPAAPYTSHRWVGGAVTHRERPGSLPLTLETGTLLEGFERLCAPML